MKGDCTQEESIKELREALPGVKNSTELLAQSYKTLAESHAQSVGDIRTMRDALTEHLLSMREVTVRMQDQSAQIQVLFAKADTLNGTVIPDLRSAIYAMQLDLVSLKGVIGDVSISGLDKRQALSETILKGVSFVGGAFIVAIIGLGVAAVYGSKL